MVYTYVKKKKKNQYNKSGTYSSAIFEWNNKEIDIQD